MSRALELIDLQLAELAAAAAPNSPNYRPDEQAYQDRRHELQQILDQLHVAAPYRWASVATAVAALKAEFTEFDWNERIARVGFDQEVLLEWQGTVRPDAEEVDLEFEVASELRPPPNPHSVSP